LDTLAAAYAETGRFKEAMKTARESRALPRAASDEELVRELQGRLKLYEAGRTYSEKR